MGFALYQNLGLKGHTVFANTSYFNSSKSEDNPASEFRPWRLNHYGHHLAYLLNHPGPRISEEEFVMQYRDYYQTLMMDEEFLMALFPLPSEEKLKLPNESNCDFDWVELCTVVHVRQGDFYEKASLVLNDDYYIRAIKYLNNVQDSQSKLLIISDEPLHPQRRDKLMTFLSSLKQTEVKYFVGGVTLQLTI